MQANCSMFDHSQFVCSLITSWLQLFDQSDYLLTAVFFIVSDYVLTAVSWLQSVLAKGKRFHVDTGVPPPTRTIENG